MELTRKNWKTYIDNLAKADDKAAELVMAYLETHEIESDKGFQAFVNYFYDVVTKYSMGASEMAAQAYETLAEAQGVYIKSAMPAATPQYGEVIKAIRGTMLSSDQPKSLAQAAGRLVRRTGVDTTINNALRDSAEYAWVPNGDTCVYCMWLASLGWMRASKKAIKKGHAAHVHANCDCTYAIRFDGKSTVEGYDPDYYKAIYDNAEGEKWQDKLNSMRRAKYAVNKDKINAQKRIAYKRREGTSASRETIKRQSISQENVGLNNEYVLKSVGAKSKNYDIMDLSNGEIYHLAEGTYLRDKQVFAGKGTKTPYREAEKYAERYGGKVDDWQHAKAIGTLSTPDGNRDAEIHWSQCEGIGKQELFIKEWLE